MKKTIIASMFVAATAMAGTTSKEVMPPAPISEPGLWQWFAGASAGYLFDYEEEMYHLHLGVDAPWDWNGWRSSFFLELGYTQNEASIGIIDPSVSTAPVGTVLATDFSMMPVTLNYKIEREIAPNLNFYAGAGLGVAFTEFDGFARFAFGPDYYVSQDDESFYAQIFTGLNYEVTESFELYGGFRWLYLDSSDVAGAPLTGIAGFEDDFLGEIGLRFNF